MFGYSSLFTCLVQEFQYPEATAYRLLNAMKLVSEVPEVEGKIQSGQLSVSAIAQVQSYCQAQKIEHLQPFAKNGTHKLSNLLLYCRNHNLHFFENSGKL